MRSLIILGRQPALGIAELESLFGAAAVLPVGTTAALLDVDPSEVAFDRLGGAMKLARVLTILDSTDWQKIESHLVRVATEHANRLSEGKLLLGLSAYGLRVTTGQMLATGLSLKKAIKQTGRPVRLVPNKELELNTAQVLHNNLTGEHGWELLLVRDGDKTILAQTVRVQDIESYTIRDRDRPKRDARIGMLPPKLAQIIINLAAANTEPGQGTLVLDPFCGTGVVLQEATLMGFDVYGSDLDARMVEYTDENMMWLLHQPECPVRRSPETYDDPAWRYYGLEVGDATSHSWQPIPQIIAAEAYLGRPFTSTPTPAILQDTISDCNLIIKKFLRNIYGQIPSGTRLCIAIPAWQTRPHQFKHLPLLDQIEDMGYNRISFEHARSEDLLYYRPDQIVARELLIVIKK